MSVLVERNGYLKGYVERHWKSKYEFRAKGVVSINCLPNIFPSISVTDCFSWGYRCFPNEPAAVIALSTIKEWLAKNQHEDSCAAMIEWKISNPATIIELNSGKNKKDTFSFL
ncbi:hypothetical protein E5288_WYG019272 [Bos mutus]|uniref:Uncharacterized protein n=1 Tax=Bos mutus TaxID=72004 RepID=A0A6B0S3W2_9CETA|nr:hypothetical protein [Bos mutus]